MPNFNKAILVGHLTRDPELQYLQSGTAVCRFSLAVNRYWSKDGQRQEEVSFFDCQAWAKTAERVAQYLKKGAPVLVDGHLKQDRWDDRQTGQKRSKVVVVCDTVQLLGGRPADQGAPPGAYAPSTGTIPAGQPAYPPAPGYAPPSGQPYPQGAPAPGAYPPYPPAAPPQGQFDGGGW